MQKLFWNDPYQSHLITNIVAIKNQWLLFKETIAFSFAGGQESDKAKINEFPVLDSQIEDNFIYYKLVSDHGLSVGDEVCMTIDWPRRYKLMRLHFAAELVLEITMRRIKVLKIGAHIAETKARIDFVCAKNISYLFEDILQAYNQIINRNLPIKTGFSDVARQRRYWKIEGFAKVSCGGTHVKSTKEVGLINLKRVNVGSGKERIEIKLVDS